MTSKKAAQITKKAEDVKINAPVQTVETAKTETAAPAVKAEVKAEEKETVKEAAKVEAPKTEVKAETVKAEAPKAEPKKRGRKPKAVKEAEAAQAAKEGKTTKAVKAAKAEKKEAVQNVYVQFEGKEVLTSQLVAQVTESWVAMGHRASSIKELNLYVKPEDHAAYYVINGKVQGKIDL